MEILEVLAIIAIASGVLGYVFYGNKKSNLPNKNLAPNDTVKELSEKEIQLKQLEYLKNIQYQSERSAKNLAFITWLIVISMIISFFTIVSNS